MRSIPYVPQSGSGDCGAACLSTVLSYFGRDVPVSELHDQMATGHGATNARVIAELARSHGLQARGVKLESRHLRDLPRASILHWQFRHFVVFDRVSRQGVHIVDPRRGPVVLTHEQCSRDFTGVAVTFEPGPDFVTIRAGRLRRPWLWAIATAQRAALAEVLVLSILLQAAALLLPLAIGYLVDNVFPRRDISLLFTVFAGVLLIVLFRAAVTLGRSYLLIRVKARADEALGLLFVKQLMLLPLSYFRNRRAGDVIARFTSSRSLREILSSSAVSAVIDGCLLFGYLALILRASALIGLAVLAAAVFQCLVFWLFRQRFRAAMTRALETEGQSNAELTDIVRGIEPVKVSGAEFHFFARWSKSFVEEIKATNERARVFAWFETTQATLMVGAPLLTLFLAAWPVFRGEMTLGTMFAINAMAAALFPPLVGLLGTAVQIQELRSHLARIDDVLATSPEPTTGERPALRGDVELHGVSFSYGGRCPTVLRDVDLTIRRGESIGILGASGSGKSTLAALIAGLYSPTGGRVTYDGVESTACDLAYVRRSVAFVPQDNYLFGVSILDNITMGDGSISLEAAHRATALAEIHEHIVTLPLGYDTVLTDGGSTLSGGQRQRIAIARALARDPHVLILDEATSHLDPETEARVLTNIAQLGCALVLISHRRNILSSAERVYVLKQGRLELALEASAWTETESEAS